MEPGLQGQKVVVIGGSAGIGLETARRARAEGAEVILAARNRERLERAGQELGAQSTAAFDAGDTPSLRAVLRGAGDAGRSCAGFGRRPAVPAPAGDDRG